MSEQNRTRINEAGQQQQRQKGNETQPNEIKAHSHLASMKEIEPYLKLHWKSSKFFHWVCVYVFVCACKYTHTQSEREGKERKRERVRARVCVCVVRTTKKSISTECLASIFHVCQLYVNELCVCARGLVSVSITFVYLCPFIVYVFVFVSVHFAIIAIYILETTFI